MRNGLINSTGSTHICIFEDIVTLFCLQSNNCEISGGDVNLLETGRDGKVMHLGNAYHGSIHGVDDIFHQKRSNDYVVSGLLVLIDMNLQLSLCD